MHLTSETPLSFSGTPLATLLFVGNLPVSITDHLLHEAFSECGRVKTARIVVDRETGSSKGIAFVEMETEQEAQVALKRFDGFEVDGHKLEVSEASPHTR